MSVELFQLDDDWEEFEIVNFFSSGFSDEVKSILSKNFQIIVYKQPFQQIYIRDWDDEIGCISTSTFPLELGNYTRDHLFVEIDEKFRNKGLSTKLFEVYDEIFGLPDLEYTRDKKKFFFFLKIWYTPTEMICEKTWSRSEFVDSDIEKIWRGYICEFEKQKLG